MMRRPGIIGLDAFQLHGFQHAGLALHLLFQKLDEPALPRHHFVQLLHLMFEVREVRLKFFDAPGHFICHAGILRVISGKVEPAAETAAETDWLFAGFVYFVVQNFSCRPKLQFKSPAPT